MSITESDSTDNRRTREMIVVEDVPESLDRIAAYIHQVDCPPRQVLLEAHILQVTLKDTEKNGVNFDALFRIAGADGQHHQHSQPGLRGDPGTGRATNATVGSGVIATVAGHDLQAVIELLQTTNDTKTLGSPKILVLNQQEARIHVGEDHRLPDHRHHANCIHRTGASSCRRRRTCCSRRESRATIACCCTSRPKYRPDDQSSSPRYRTRQTTELETDVMLNDGQGMVIGGLIKENDSTTQSKIPYLGDLWRVGFFFRNSDITKERDEIIVAIVPRIQPYAPEFADFEQGELVEAETPLFQGPLCYTDRPWDAKLPDGKRVAKPYIPRRPMLPEVDRSRPNYCNAPWPQYYVPHKPYPEQHLHEDCRRTVARVILRRGRKHSRNSPASSCRN